MARIIELESQITPEPISLDTPIGEEDDSDKIIDLVASHVNTSEKAVNNAIIVQCRGILGDGWKRKLQVIIAYGNLPEPKENWARKIVRQTGEKEGFVCTTIRGDLPKLRKYLLAHD